MFLVWDGGIEGIAAAVARNRNPKHKLELPMDNCAALHAVTGSVVCFPPFAVWAMVNVDNLPCQASSFALPPCTRWSATAEDLGRRDIALVKAMWDTWGHGLTDCWRMVSWIRLGSVDGFLALRSWVSAGAPQRSVQVQTPGGVVMQVPMPM